MCIDELSYLVQSLEYLGDNNSNSFIDFKGIE